MTIHPKTGYLFLLNLICFYGFHLFVQIQFIFLGHPFLSFRVPHHIHLPVQAHRAIILFRPRCRTARRGQRRTGRWWCRLRVPGLNHKKGGGRRLNPSLRSFRLIYGVKIYGHFSRGVLIQYSVPGFTKVS